MQIEARLSADDVEAIAQRVAEILKPLIGGDLPEPVDQLISEQLAAAEHGVAPHVLRDARKRGLIEFIRVGRSVRYSREQLDQFKRRQTNGEVAR